MKILIVDDEALIREKLRGALQSYNLPVREYLLCDNALDAMELIESKSPDVVLSDIRMPVKDGLELAAWVHENHPQIPVILITGYSDFEYARSALRSGVFEYILKPVEPEKLVQMVLRAQKKRDQEQRHERLYAAFQEYFSENQESVKKQYIENLLFGRFSPEEADSHREALRLNFAAYRLVAVSCRTVIDGNRMEGQYYCTYLMEKYIRELLPQTVTYAFGDLVFFFWEVRQEDVFSDNQVLLSLLRRARAYARRDLMGQLSVGISQVSRTFSNIQNLRRQTSECLELLQGGDQEDFLFYEDVRDPDQGLWEAESAVQVITSDVRAGNEKAVLAHFDELCRRLEEGPPEVMASTCLVIVSNLSFLLHDLNLETGEVQRLTDEILPHLSRDDPQECAVRLREWLSELCRRVSGELQSRSSVVVTSVKEYINLHYGEPVGLAEASRSVGRNPSYVSRLIKEYTGKNFTQLLTEKRMTEAKRLLKETPLKVNEIAERVGYGNVRYFNRVFKTVTNMSANDYRAVSAALE